MDIVTLAKRTEFLFIVQTTLLANAINISTLKDSIIEKNRHVISESGLGGIIGDAVKTSHFIPEDMSAFDAAYDFLDYFVENIDKNENPKKIKPSWIPEGFFGYPKYK